MLCLNLLAIGAFALTSSTQQVLVTAQESNYTLVQPVYKPLTLGLIESSGWLKDQLELEASGLGGNLFNFYRFVHDSEWIGGSEEYSNLDEASPYWFNGLVPLAFGLKDETVQSQVKYYLDYVIDHQQDDGWLGFETTVETRGIWARCLLLLGMMQYAEADPTETDRIVDSMHKFVEIAHSMLQNNFTGLINRDDQVFDIGGFGLARTHELHIPLQWLLENYPQNNSQIIWETMELMIEGGQVAETDWRTFWVEGVYPEVCCSDNYTLFWGFTHGVNHAEGLRYTLAVYRMTHDEALKEQTRTALDLLKTWHKSPAGTIIADEIITDLSPRRGAELCIAAEIMFSLNEIYQYLGDNDIADWMEQASFNALPVSISADWWSHQYVQQVNQPWSRNLTEDGSLFTDVNSYGQVFGLEPDYPCCLVNHPQAYPKFAANTFVQTQDGGLAHVYLVSGSIATTIGSNNVTVTATTDYPFSFDIDYEITSSEAFDFYVRVPEWADDTSSMTSDSQSTPLAPSAQGLHQVPISPGVQTQFSVSFNTQPRVENTGNQSVAVYYGPLLYSLAIETNVTATEPLDYYYQTPLYSNTTTSQSHDHIMLPTSPWAVAIDPSQISVVKNNQTTSAGNLQSPIWSLGAPPVELRIAAVEIDWPTDLDTPVDPPENPTVTGEPFCARFVPYGSAKLHMAQLPTVDLAKNATCAS